MDYSDSRMVSEGRVLIEVLNWPPLVCGLTHRTENRVASRILNPTLPQEPWLKKTWETLVSWMTVLEFSP